MNKSSIIAVVLVAALVLVGGGLFFLSGDDNSDSVNSSEPQQEVGYEATVENPEEELGSFSAADVATHNTEDDCWTIIDGKVYDITLYIPRHPGGSTVLLACGGDGTSLFNERTTSEGETVGSGTPHSGGAQSKLQDYLIGDLVN